MFIPALRRLPSISTLMVFGPMVAMMELVEGKRSIECTRVSAALFCLSRWVAVVMMPVAQAVDTHVLRKYLLVALMECSSGLREAYHSS